MRLGAAFAVTVAVAAGAVAVDAAGTPERGHHPHNFRSSRYGSPGAVDEAALSPEAASPPSSPSLPLKSSRHAVNHPAGHAFLEGSFHPVPASQSPSSTTTAASKTAAETASASADLGLGFDLDHDTHLSIDAETLERDAVAAFSAAVKDLLSPHPSRSSVAASASATDADTNALRHELRHELEDAFVEELKKALSMTATPSPQATSKVEHDKDDHDGPSSQPSSSTSASSEEAVDSISATTTAAAASPSAADSEGGDDTAEGDELSRGIANAFVDAVKAAVGVAAAPRPSSSAAAPVESPTSSPADEDSGSDEESTGTESDDDGDEEEHADSFGPHGHTSNDPVGEGVRHFQALAAADKTYRPSAIGYRAADDSAVEDDDFDVAGADRNGVGVQEADDDEVDNSEEVDADDVDDDELDSETVDDDEVHDDEIDDDDSDSGEFDNASLESAKMQQADLEEDNAEAEDEFDTLPDGARLFASRGTGELFDDGLVGDPDGLVVDPADDPAGRYQSFYSPLGWWIPTGAGWADYAVVRRARRLAAGTAAASKTAAVAAANSTVVVSSDDSDDGSGEVVLVVRRVRLHPPVSASLAASAAFVALLVFLWVGWCCILEPAYVVVPPSYWAAQPPPESQAPLYTDLEDGRRRADVTYDPAASTRRKDTVVA
ncbi:hypothetical protein HK405_011780 [Cladochytrium tenue]|nr:hypothetical protein HK405_011780 [Cladochytrium tenue]